MAHSVLGGSTFAIYRHRSQLFKCKRGIFLFKVWGGVKYYIQQNILSRCVENIKYLGLCD